jgi:alanyl-tRNA synthetase
VLGETARQAGSLVAADHLRFDFTYPEAMTQEQVERVEKLVNNAMTADMEVITKIKMREEAIAEGAVALFGEKYGDTVRTITIAQDSDNSISGRQSFELCGGTHLEHTSDAGVFIILSEGSAAAGIRRIEAVTGRGAYELISRHSKLLNRAAWLLKSTVDEVPERVEMLQEEISLLRKQTTGLKTELALKIFNDGLPSVVMVSDLRLLVMEIPGADKDTLAILADKFREKIPDKGICVIGASDGDQVIVMSAVTHDLVKKGIKAGELVGLVSRQLGAGGGGAPHLAFGGGKDVAKLPMALMSVRDWVSENVK